ncbi:hypothetical protein H8356DRAFT_1331196 [Neocallimastix lanati (nom. inval.)]|nr:hypothetical protein H8356DRAFT_1331196 [Neocallimastix sp. JGI-2020a]
MEDVVKDYLLAMKATIVVNEVSVVNQIFLAIDKDIDDIDKISNKLNISSFDDELFVIFDYLNLTFTSEKEIESNDENEDEDENENESESESKSEDAIKYENKSNVVKSDYQFGFPLIKVKGKANATISYVNVMIFVMPVKGEEVKCDNLFNDNLHKIKKKSSSLLTLAKNKLMRTACKADAEVMTTTVKLVIVNSTCAACAACGYGKVSIYAKFPFYLSK